MAARDRWRCFYCDRALHCPTCEPGRHGRTTPATRDHLIPLSRGGIEALSNQVAACQPCNNRKGHRLVWAFLAELDDEPRRVDMVARLTQRMIVPPHILARFGVADEAS